MSEDVSDFDQSMRLGLESHRRDDYISALGNRFDAFYASDAPQPYDRGRAARDIAATFDRLGDTALSNKPYETDLNKTDLTNQYMAEAYAEYAYREHSRYHNSIESYVTFLSTREGREDSARRNIPRGCMDLTYLNDQGAREFTVSAMYVAIIAARQDRGDDALRFINEGWSRSTYMMDKKGGKPHQYDVNMIGRVIGIRGFFANQHSGRGTRLGSQAREFPKISQTDKVLGYDTSLTPQQVRRAQLDARIRNLSARTVARTQSSSTIRPIRKATKPLAGYLLRKVVL